MEGEHGGRFVGDALHQLAGPGASEELLTQRDAKFGFARAPFGAAPQLVESRHEEAGHQRAHEKRDTDEEVVEVAYHDVPDGWREHVQQQHEARGRRREPGRVAEQRCADDGEQQRNRGEFQLRAGQPQQSARGGHDRATEERADRSRLHPTIIAAGGRVLNSASERQMSEPLRQTSISDAVVSVRVPTACRNIHETCRPYVPRRRSAWPALTRLWRGQREQN